MTDKRLLSIARQVLTGVNGHPALIDDITWAKVMMTFEHHEIHEGDHYNLGDYTTGVAVDGTIEFVVTTPDTTKWAHLVFNVYSSLGAKVDLYEGASDIVGGTAQTPRNNNRNSANTSAMTILKDPTSITDGTKASGYLAGAGRNAGNVQRANEFILKQNTTYLMRITSLANSNAISWSFDWYEHTNKEEGA